jgi:hypothetical protein
MHPLIGERREAEADFFAGGIAQFAGRRNIVGEGKFAVMFATTGALAS